MRRVVHGECSWFNMRVFRIRRARVRPAIYMFPLLLCCLPARAAVTCDQLGNLALATEQYRNEGVPLEVLMAEADKLASDGSMSKDDMTRIKKTVQDSFSRMRTPVEIRKDCKDVPAK